MFSFDVLRRLYGLKHGGDRTEDFKRSPDRLSLFEDEINQKVFGRATVFFCLRTR